MRRISSRAREGALCAAAIRRGRAGAPATGAPRRSAAGTAPRPAAAHAVVEVAGHAPAFRLLGLERVPREARSVLRLHLAGDVARHDGDRVPDRLGVLWIQAALMSGTR